MKLFTQMITLVLTISMPCIMSAQDVLEFRGVKANCRYDDGSTYKSTYVGWDSEAGKAIFDGDQGLWKMESNGDTVTTSVLHYDNLMYANSGAVYKNDTIVTVYSRESDDENQQMEFKVRWWNATSGKLIREETFKKTHNLESRGMSYNPIDGKVYGLFYFTNVPLPEGATSDEETQDGDSADAGYALATVDLNTMAVTQITPGLYYDNFVFLVCSPEGRIFSMTAGGTLVEFDRQTGIIMTKKETDKDGNEILVNKYPDSGVKSQFKRQAACFDYKTGKLYWNGFINNGMGYNEFGSYGPLSDKDWKTNGKYDTALYEIDTETGFATRIAGIENRLSLACMWMPGHDASETTDIKEINQKATSNFDVYNIAGILVKKNASSLDGVQKGMYILKYDKVTKKVNVE